MRCHKKYDQMEIKRLVQVKRELTRVQESIIEEGSWVLMTGTGKTMESLIKNNNN